MTDQQLDPIKPSKTSVMAVDRIMALIPRSIDEAWRLSEAFVLAGMVPNSLEVKNDQKATTARVMTVMLKGMEVGLGPASALQSIMVINQKPCIYGDGASSLVNASGIVEYIKTDITGTSWGPGYKVTVTLKRRDQSEPIVRSFSYEDAKRAGLANKSGPWTYYPERQCYWRAWSWAARDGASDALMGLAIKEEVDDFKIEQAREQRLDTSDLDAGLPPPKQIEAPKEDLPTGVWIEKVDPDAHPDWSKKKWGLGALEIVTGLKEVKTLEEFHKYLSKNESGISNVREHAHQDVVEAVDFAVQNKSVELGQTIRKT